MSILKQKNSGSVLVIALVGISIGAIVVGSLMRYSAHSNASTEKEVGHTKSAEALKLATNLYNTTIANESNLTDDQITIVSRLIGGGGPQKPVFGQSSQNVNSSIPGFDEYSVSWLDPVNILGTTMLPPNNQNGFWYFPGSYTAKVVAVHSGDNVPTLRNNSRALISSQNPTMNVPVFSMLSFYDKDWEIAAHYESAQLIGHIHSNGSIYLDCRESGPDRISFHGMQDFPILSADDAVYRRGKNGATSYYKFGSTANYGLDFWIYSLANYSSIINPTDFNYTNNTNRLFSRDLTPDYTSYEDAPIGSDNAAEALRRRFGGGTVGDDFGYVYTGTSSVNGNTFNAPSTTAGTTVAVIQYGNQVNRLSPPVSIDPYQYIEDIQFFDTPDTINYASPTSSNYQEDSARNNRVAGLAYNSIAPLVIRDGVAYYRTSPGGGLNPVVELIGINPSTNTLYPSSTHTNARRYGDLRWYGWFGMNDGVIAPTPDNPARWHFPIKSVTYNATQDIKNAGNLTDSAEGTAVAFTFNNSNIINPINDGIRNSLGGIVPATWIRNDIDLDGLSGYPGSNTNAATDSNSGTGIGMYNVSYNTLSTNNYERFDPVRIGYNIVKENIRRLYNAHHIYTSKHDGIRMLNFGGTTPANGVAPDVWGAGITAASFGGGTDYDNADLDKLPNTGVDFSAFWNDDGAMSSAGSFRYLRIKITDNNGHPSQTRITELEWISTTNASGTEISLPQSNPSAYTYGASSAQTGSHDQTEAFDGNYNPSNGWQSGPSGTFPYYVWLDSGTDKNNWIDPAKIKMTMAVNSSNADAAPRDFELQGSFDNIKWTTLASISDKTWTGTSTLEIQLAGPKLYSYIRDQSTTNTDARSGSLLLNADDNTPRVELFPIRHYSIVNTGVAPTKINDWGIFKSTLPLNDRTLAMPLSRNLLDGWDYTNKTYLPYSPPVYNDTTNLDPRIVNFGGAPINSSSGNNSRQQNAYNWYVLANNAPERLARLGTTASPLTTFETDFRYYGGDCGGYYGNDNLSMINVQERKIEVFTEIDLSELTPECFTFNGLTGQWGFNFDTNATTVTQTNRLQNIIYVVNTTMGKNFYGKRVHCGAVRLKKGAVLQYPLSIATPNAIHIWGDFNCPGYWHHGKNKGNSSVSYVVPNFREHAPNTRLASQSVALYSDSVSAYENSWIRFDLSNANANDNLITSTTAVLKDGYNHYYGCLRNAITDRQNENIAFDHKLWWEDDGMRREGNGATISDRGTQLFLNYHEMVFNHASNDIYKLNSAWDSRGSSHQIWKHIPQGINAALMYGNVESRLPSYFYKADVDALSSFTRPASIDELDWYMSWIPRRNWMELTRDQMRNDQPDTLNNGGFNPTSLPGGSSYYCPNELTLDNYYGTSFPDTGTTRWENCKLKFSGGGFLYDIRQHTNHTHALDEWESGRQEYGRNIRGAFSCLFDSRQNTHGFNNTLLGTENQQIFYSYELNFNNSGSLPPGTPMTTIIPGITYTIEGSKWEY